MRRRGWRELVRGNEAATLPSRRVTVGSLRPSLAADGATGLAAVLALPDGVGRTALTRPGVPPLCLTEEEVSDAAAEEFGLVDVETMPRIDYLEGGVWRQLVPHLRLLNSRICLAPEVESV